MNREERRGFVASHRTAIFGYNRRQDGPAMSVVYYVVDGDDILVSTMAARAKAKAMARPIFWPEPVIRARRPTRAPSSVVAAMFILHFMEFLAATTRARAFGQDAQGNRSRRAVRARCPPPGRVFR